MTKRVFHRIAELGETFVVSVWHKQGIVAKSRTSARGVQELASADAFEQLFLAGWADDK